MLIKRPTLEKCQRAALGLIQGRLTGTIARGIHIVLMGIGLVAVLRVGAFAANIAPAINQSILQSIETKNFEKRLPPYLEYTATFIQTTAQGELDRNDSFTLRVWMRTSDHAALTTKIYGTVQGDREFRRPTFYDGDYPSPILADALRIAPRDAKFGVEVAPELHPIAGLMGSYSVVRQQDEPGALRLDVRPREGSSSIYRLQSLYIDPATDNVRALRAADDLLSYSPPRRLGNILLTVYPRSDDEFGLLRRIDVTPLDGQMGSWSAVEQFTDFAFPTTLPNWYFDPSSYGAHAKEPLAGAPLN